MEQHKAGKMDRGQTCSYFMKCKEFVAQNQWEAMEEFKNMRAT